MAGVYPGGHDEFFNHVGRGLGALNGIIDLTGDGTIWAAVTTVAGMQAITNAYETNEAIHVDQRSAFRRFSRYQDNLKAMGIFGDTEAAATNTTALGEAQFTAQDPRFPAAYRGNRP